MELPEASPDRFVLAICPQCREPLYPPKEQEGHEVPCPECGAAVPVPKTPRPKIADEPATKEYGVHDAEYVPKQIEYIKLSCPTCRTLLYAEPDRVGTKITCPDCGVKVLVREATQPKSRQRRPEEIGDYAVLDDHQPSRINEKDHYLVVCPRCNTRLHPSRKLAGRRGKCPDCGEKFRLPDAPPDKSTASGQAVDAYTLETPETRRLDIDEYFAFSCFHCGTRLTVERRQAGKKIRCPDCRRTVLVPSPGEKRKPRLREIAQDHSVADDFTQAPALAEPVQPESIAHPIPDASPPRWTFFSGVFSFPWQGEALSRWALLSLGLVVSGELAAGGLIFSGFATGEVSLIGGFSMAFFGMAIFWTGLWTLSYAAGCMLGVMQDTSSGSIEVLSWPGGDWREWVWPLLHVGYIAGVAVAAGYIFYWPVQLAAGHGGVAWLFAAYLFFPVFLVSSMEGNSAVVILTRPVIGSLWSLAWGWLLVYALSAAMLAGLITVVWLAVQLSGLVVPIVAAPLVAAMLLIYARLLGRLAWRVTT